MKRSTWLMAEPTQEQDFPGETSKAARPSRLAPICRLRHNLFNRNNVDWLHLRRKVKIR